MTPSTTAATVTLLELEPAPPEVKRYEQQKLIAQVVSGAVSLAALAVLALGAGPALDRGVRGLTGPGPWLRLVVLAVVYGATLELLALPLAFWSGFLLEHRYRLSNETFGGWLKRRLKGWLVGGPINLLVLLGLYALLRHGGPYWWLWAAAAWLAVRLAVGYVLPVVLPLFYRVTRLEDADLLRRLRGLAEGTGLAVEGIYRLGLSAETRKGNAALAGLGRARRVLLGDTLLEQLTAEEIAVVFAHEVGHHVHRHRGKALLGELLLTVGGLGLVAAVLPVVAGGLGYPADAGPAYADPASLPLLRLALAVVALLPAPLLLALSRWFERQSDRYALRRTGLPRAFRSALIKVARLNKLDPDPPAHVVWLFDSHPPIRQRLALAAP
jgi:STE24 endopeptidase